MHAQRSRRRKVHAPGILVRVARVRFQPQCYASVRANEAKRCSSQCICTVWTHYVTWQYVTWQGACNARHIGLPCRRAALALQRIWTVRLGRQMSWAAATGAVTVKMTKHSGRSEDSESNEHEGFSLHWLGQRHKPELCAAHEHLEAAADGPCAGIAIGSACECCAHKLHPRAQADTMFNPRSKHATSAPRCQNVKFTLGCVTVLPKLFVFACSASHPMLKHLAVFACSCVVAHRPRARARVSDPHLGVQDNRSCNGHSGTTPQVTS